MTNQWVCMTSSSEHSFIRDLGFLSERTPPTLSPIHRPPVRYLLPQKPESLTYQPFMQTLIIEMMSDEFGKGILRDDMARVSQVGDQLLGWIDAYSRSPGNARACWVGTKKKLVCMTWRDVDMSDEEEDEDYAEEEEEDDDDE
jgi:hypothetical protein